MTSLYAVIAKTTDHESVLDSLWDDRDEANDRRDTIWDYPTIFRAEVKKYALNKVDTDSLAYEMMKDVFEDSYDEW